MSPIDMSGKRFGRLLVLDRAENYGTSASWRCLCDCGATVVRSGGNLRLGKTLSCGCLRKEKLVARNVSNSKGRQDSGLYETWRSMLRRCYEPSHPSFRFYGERGIGVCEQWRESFETFLLDMGPCPEGMTLDREDSKGNYEPGNCRWADDLTQGNNRRNVLKFELNGKRVSLAEACRITGISYHTAAGRVRRGWPIERAATEAAKW